MRWGLRALSFVLALCFATVACAQYYGGPLLFFPILASKIGTPVLIGSVSTGSGNSIPIPISSPIVGGQLVVAAFGPDAATCSSVSDGTNSYTKVNSATYGSDPADIEFWYNANPIAVASGNITCSTTAGNTAWLGIAAQVSGILTVSPLDANPTPVVNNSVTTSTSISSGVLAQAKEIVFGTVSINTTSNITVGAGFTQMVATGVHGGDSVSLEYQIVNATPSVTWNPSFASSKNAAVMGSFKGR